jgi:hypothetical protein
MFRTGDRILFYLSGSQESLSMMHALHQYQSYCTNKVRLVGIITTIMLWYPNFSQNIRLLSFVSQLLITYSMVSIVPSWWNANEDDSKYHTCYSCTVMRQLTIWNVVCLLLALTGGHIWACCCHNWSPDQFGWSTVCEVLSTRVGNAVLLWETL